MRFEGYISNMEETHLFLGVQHLLNKVSTSFAVTTVVAAVSFYTISVASLYFIVITNQIQSIVEDPVGAHFSVACLIFIKTVAKELK